MRVRVPKILYQEDKDIVQDENVPTMNSFWLSAIDFK